jgi:hypothetical protein
MNRISLASAAAVGLFSILTATAVSAAPPPPPPQPNIQFGIQFGTPGDDQGSHHHHSHNECLDDRDIYLGLRDQGYQHIRPVSDDGDTLTFDARRGPRAYELTVDSCSGDILDRQRIFQHY